MGYVDGYVIPVPAGKREDYRKMAAITAPIFRDHGAIRVVECWGDDLPDGKVTDFRMAVKAEAGENVVLGWVHWPSKTVRDEGMAKFMTDARMTQNTDAMPFDGKRMFFGGFEVMLDEGV